MAHGLDFSDQWFGFEFNKRTEAIKEKLKINFCRR